jgi:hypothetical protein
MPDAGRHVPSGTMNSTRTVLAFSLAWPWAMSFALAGCEQKEAPTPAASATAAPAAPTCPSGSSLAGNICKATGQNRVATLTWSGNVNDSGPLLTVKNSSSMGLKNGTVSLWFYDKTGKRLDVAGTKHYQFAGDIFAGPLAAGAQKNTTFNFAKANIPTGTAEIEGEIVSATLQKTDGSDGSTWKNDDLNADERAMTGTPPPNAVAAAPAPGPTAPAVAATTPPGAKPTSAATTARPGSPAPPRGH